MSNAVWPDNGHSKVSHFISIVAVTVGRSALSSELHPVSGGHGTDSLFLPLPTGRRSAGAAGLAEA